MIRRDFPISQVLFANGVLVRGVTCVLFPLSMLGFCLAGICSGLASVVTDSEFICSPALLYQDDTVSWESSTMSDSYNPSVSSSAEIS